MDPTLNFQGEWYFTGIMVTTGTMVTMLISIASWRFIIWLRQRRYRHAHKPLLDEVVKERETNKRRTSLRDFFKKGGQRLSEAGRATSECDENSDTYSLKRSSTVQSKASLVSSSSSKSSIPPMIVQGSQPSDIYIPEMRKSSLSIDSSISGFEISQYQNEGSEAEGSIKSRSSIKRKALSNKGEDSLLSDALEEEEEDDEEDENGEDNKQENEKNKVGSLMFNLEHDKHRDSLTIHIIKATDLALSSSNNKSNSGNQTALVFDPYVRLVLLPEGKQKAKTRIARRTRNPIFEETFTFYGINYQKLVHSIVRFSVVSHDRFSKDQMIGHVLLPITPKIITKDRHMVTLCRSILSSIQLIQKPGELFISLNFDPSSDKLTVVILKARNLPKMDMAGLADPYVKVYFMCDGLRAGKKKTQVKRRTLNPIFNETFHFTLPPHFEQRVPEVEENSAVSSNLPPINQVLLKFVIHDYDRVSKNEVMGKVEIGPDVTNESGLKHWKDVMAAPRKQLAVWHKI